MTRLKYLALALGLTAGAAHAADATISVSGQGIARVEPDIAIITMGVREEAPLARDALAAASATTARIMGQLRGLGLPERDLRTSSLGLNPVWDRSKTADRHRIVAYAANSDLTVTLRDLTMVGSALDAVTRVGANRVSGPYFEVSDMDAARKQARAQAMEDALARATQLASSVGLELGQALKITEGRGPDDDYDAMPFAPRAAMAMSDASAEMPVAAGESEVSVSVSVIFAARPAK